MRIGIDVDGVLANFEQRYLELLIKTSGRTLLTPDDISPPKTWYWERDAGYTKEEEKAAWVQILLGGFWVSLDVRPGAKEAVNTLERIANEFYFITTRPGYRVQEETCIWLTYKLGMQGFPNVIIAGKDKEPILEALNLDFYIDDKLENANAAKYAGVKHPFLLNYPYNAGDVAFGVTRVDRLEEFVDVVRN